MQYCIYEERGAKMIFDESQGFQNTVQFEDSRSMFNRF
jgi:hypothetical protein